MQPQNKKGKLIELSFLKIQKEIQWLDDIPSHLQYLLNKKKNRAFHAHDLNNQTLFIYLIETSQN